MAALGYLNGVNISMVLYIIMCILVGYYGSRYFFTKGDSISGVLFLIGAITLFMATGLGIPVSTTHTITGAIVGVGAARKVSAVRWNVAGNIVIAWVLTIPCAALLGAAFYNLALLLW